MLNPDLIEFIEETQIKCEEYVKIEKPDVQGGSKILCIQFY